MDSILPRISTSAKKHASMGAWDKTDLLPRSHSVWIKNIRIEVQEALDGSSKAPGDTHERVVGLELVHCTNVQQLPVFDAIQHPCVSMVSTFKRSGSSNEAGKKSVCLHGNLWRETMSAK